MDLGQLVWIRTLTVGHGGSSAGSYLADLTSPIPFHYAVIILFKSVPVHQLSVTSTSRVNISKPWNLTNVKLTCHLYITSTRKCNQGTRLPASQPAILYQDFFFVKNGWHIIILNLTIVFADVQSDRPCLKALHSSFLT